MAYSSVTINPTTSITSTLLNQMIANDEANESILNTAPDNILGYVEWDDNGQALTSEKNSSPIYYDNVGTTTLIDPLQINAKVESSGMYRIMFIAPKPTTENTDSSACNLYVRNIAGTAANNLQRWRTPTSVYDINGIYPPAIQWIDRYLVAGKIYNFGVYVQITGGTAKVYPSAILDKTVTCINYFTLQKISNE